MLLKKSKSFAEQLTAWEKGDNTMPNMTFPNQKKVCIHREIPKTDFLGIKNENWQAAARDLKPFSLALYLYLASNADNYTLALSPVAVEEAIGMKRSTYND